MYKEITTPEKIFAAHSDGELLKQAEAAIAFLPERFRTGMLSLMTLQAGCEVVNNDVPGEDPFKPDYNNTNQEKWAPWYRGGDESGAGFRFNDSDNDWTNTNANGRAQLSKA